MKLLRILTLGNLTDSGLTWFDSGMVGEWRALALTGHDRAWAPTWNICKYLHGILCTKTVLLAEPASLRGSQPTGKDHLHGLHVQDPHVFTAFYGIICMLHGSSRTISIWFDCSRQANPSQHFREVLHGWTWLLWSACRNNGCANAAVPCSKFIDYID